jgi:ubiquinone/menaquinone biosynthesis C-methylase UbiE
MYKPLYLRDLAQNNLLTAGAIERINRKKYEEVYDISQASINKSVDEKDYSSVMVRIRLGLIKKYGRGKTILDLCCGTGDYLFESRDIIARGIGVDFSEKMIGEAASKKNKFNAENLQFIVANAKRIPCQGGTFDLAYSFSALYHIPEAEKAVLEVSRALKPDAIAILEFGNLRSLNTLVCKAYPEYAASCHIKISQMQDIIRNSGLKIIERRRFQILPLWGQRPAALKPLLHPAWRRIFRREIKGKMLDEWVSELPIIRNFAFRQTFICKK